MDSFELDLGDVEEKEPKTSVDELAWKVTEPRELVDRSGFTKAVAKAWDESSFSTKFGQYHPNWQRVLLSFARRVTKIEV